MVKNQFDPWFGKIPWRREWQPTPVFLPGEFHGQRSLAGYIQWGPKELDTTEQLTFTFFSLSPKAIYSCCLVSMVGDWFQDPPVDAKIRGCSSLMVGSPYKQLHINGFNQLQFYGSPLQCSCLENPRESGAWWAAIYGVTQSWTQLKWLSSSSSSWWWLLEQRTDLILYHHYHRDVVSVLLDTTKKTKQNCSVWAQLLWGMWLPPGSGISVSCISRQSLYHWATREAPERIVLIGCDKQVQLCRK